MALTSGLAVARGRWVEVNEAAEAFVEVLNANGVDCLFVMPGDAFPILEAIASYRARGRPTPRVITCPHETVALAAAHGYYLVSGRPQVVLVHVDVGLQMLGGMLHNAQRARAGVVLCAGRTPMTSEGELRGGRVVEVQWLQERPDQASVVRDYVKWSYDLARPENLALVMQRAFQVAASQPAGPVYVGLLREMLMASMPNGGVRVLPPERFASPAPAVPRPQDLAEVAQLVRDATTPIVICGYVGRSAAGFAALTRLAETAALPIYGSPNVAHVSTDHPLYLGTEPGPALAEADLVLLLDVDVPWIPAFGGPAPDARIVQLDVDPLKVSMPTWGFPADIRLQCSTAEALPLLTAAIATGLTEADRGRLDARRADIAEQHGTRSADLLAAADALAERVPIAVEHLSRCLGEVVDADTIVIDDSTTASATAARYVPARVPGSYFKPQGSSMGWGSGAALGAKLAAADKLIINLNADGNFISGAPEAALWAARAHAAPYLTVVYNNAQYAAIKLGLLFEYPHGAMASAGNFQALELPNPPDFARIAQACGGYGERVTDPADVRAALRRGLDAVRNGQPALLDVVVAGP